MKFTFDLSTSLWREPSARFVDLSRHYEAAGFDRFGVADWRYYPDLYVHMTACLVATERLALESLVTDPFVRHPALTALAHATMDDLSRGRDLPAALPRRGGELPRKGHQRRAREAQLQAVPCRPPHPRRGSRQADDR